MKFMQSMFVGSGQALAIFALTAALSVPLGILVAIGRNSRFPILSQGVRIYQLIFRGTPLMLQLLFFYFGPYFLLGIRGADKFTACVVAFVINYAAYFGEIFRAGINSISHGQFEAGKVLGYTKPQTFNRIVLPQVVKRVIPPVGSEFMVLIKDTALVQIIAQPQLFDVALKTASASVSIAPYVVAGIFYLVMNAVVELVFKRLENRLDYYK